MGKAFEKQIKTIENQGEKRLKALEDLKTKGETKAIKDKHEEKNNQSSAAIIFNDLISTRKKNMNELHDSVDKNKIMF